MCKSIGLNVSVLLRSCFLSCSSCSISNFGLFDFCRTVQRAFSFEGKGLSQWQVHNVENMYNMFGQGESLHQHDLLLISHSSGPKFSNPIQYFHSVAYKFNADISGWVTSKVTDMGWLVSTTS